MGTAKRGQLVVVVQGAQFTVSADATIRTDQGNIRGSELKEYVSGHRQGWIEFGTMAELKSSEPWQAGEKKCVSWVNCLWIGAIVQEADVE